MSTSIRTAHRGDEKAIAGMIRALAEFERAPEQCTVTESQLTAALFGDDAPARCLIAEVDGETAAMALWYRTFSTWDGVAGIHLEDLYVHEDFRRRGLARALLAVLAGECVRNGYSRLGWAVLDWNTDAIALYDAVGGQPMSEWISYRVSGPELVALAAESDGP